MHSYGVAGAPVVEELVDLVAALGADHHDVAGLEAHEHEAARVPHVVHDVLVPAPAARVSDSAWLGAQHSTLRRIPIKSISIE